MEPWAEGARKLAARLAEFGLDAQPTEDLEAAVAPADVISCATLATEPRSPAALKPGQHLDLVGAFTISMRGGIKATVGTPAGLIQTNRN